MNKTYGANLPAHSLFPADASLFAETDRPADLIEALLREHKYVRIPALSTPILLDRPIRLPGGAHLSIHEETVFRMKEGCGGCMARNENVYSGMEGPVGEETRDADIISKAVSGRTRPAPPASTTRIRSCRSSGGRASFWA